LNGEYFTIRGETTGAFRRRRGKEVGAPSSRHSPPRTFPKVAALERVEALKPHCAFFEIEDARLLAMDEACDEFVQIAAPAHEATIAQARF